MAVAVVAVARTAVRPVDGELAGWNPVELAGVVGREALERAGLDPGDLDEVIVGCADPVGACGADAARAIVLAAGWPVTIGGAVVDRGETSGLAAVQAAAAAIRAGQARTVLVVGLGLCSVVPPGAAALNRAYGAPWGGVAERFAEAGGLLPGPRLAERAAEAAGMGRDELDGAAEESRRRRAEAVAGPAIVAVAARPGDAAGRGVYPGDPVAADVVRDWGDTAELPPAFDGDGLLTAATFAPPADAVAAVLLQAVGQGPGRAGIAVEHGHLLGVQRHIGPYGLAGDRAGSQSGGRPAASETGLAPVADGLPVAGLQGAGSGSEPQAGAGTIAELPVAGLQGASTESEPHGTPPAGEAIAPEGASTAEAATPSRSDSGPGEVWGRGPALATVVGTGRAAGDPFDPAGDVAVAVERALAATGTGLDAVDDIAVVEHDAATVMLVARALGVAAGRINRAGGAVATGNAGAAEELRLITDRLARTGGLLLTISAGPTGSAAILWLVRCPVRGLAGR